MHDASEIRNDGSGTCPLHSGMEEFRDTIKSEQTKQWDAINGIKNAAWLSAMSAIGSLVAVIITMALTILKVQH